MKYFLCLLLLFSFIHAETHIYKFKTNSTFLIELPSKVEKQTTLNSSYRLVVKNTNHNFDFKGHIFRNDKIKINIFTLKVYSSKINKLYNLKVKRYKAITEVKLDGIYIGKVYWSSINEFNKGLTKLSKKIYLSKNLKK